MEINMVIIFICGIIGLLGTIVWIIVDLLMRKKRNEKIIRKAVAKTSGQPVKKMHEPYASAQMTEALPTGVHSSFTAGISGMQGSGETEGPGNTASIQLTQGLDRETEKLRTQKTEMAENFEKTEAMYATVGLGKTEALEETMGLSKTTAIYNSEGADKTSALDFEMTAALDETAGLEGTAALDETEALGETKALEKTQGLGKTVGLNETEGLNKTEALNGTTDFDKTEGLKASESSKPGKAKFCINCGAPLTGSGRFCSRCGFKNNL